ncbi:MAG: hypothetical protein AAGD04_02705 [Pseudomonadota bacterium]
MSKFAMLLSAAVLALGPTLASAGSLVEPMEEVMIEEVVAAPAGSSGSLGGNAGLIIGGVVGLALIAALADSDSDDDT